jgi:hypothetical protein
LKKERYDSLKRVAAPNSGASDNERSIANRLLEAVIEAVESKPIRISVCKGVSGKSIVVRRLDRRGACTIMMPLAEGVAIKFAQQALRIKFTKKERELLCASLH